MKFKNLISGLIIAVLTSTQVAVVMAQAGLPVILPITPPITSPITGPIIIPTPTPSVFPSATPSATPKPVNGFRNLSVAMPLPGAATFKFTYSGLPFNYFYIHASTYADMSWDVYGRFAEGYGSTITQTNPTRWDKYSCGRTLYWRVESITGDKSPIQKTTVDCQAQTYSTVFGSVSYRIARYFGWGKYSRWYYINVPASGVKVTAMQHKTGKITVATTNWSGAYRMSVADGRYTVSASDYRRTVFNPASRIVNIAGGNYNISFWGVLNTFRFW